MRGFIIEKIIAREIIDSRGNPTLEVEMTLDGGITKYASVPSGISVGLFEAVELRDGDPTRYHGMGVTKAIGALEDVVAPKIIGRQFTSLREFDELIIEIDGTENKSRIGANTSLGLSLAFMKCFAQANNLREFELLRKEFKIENRRAPIPMLNIINGGKHANNNLMLQEFMIVPTMTDKASFHERMKLSCEFYADLRSDIKAAGHSTNVGDEGGFAPMFSSAEEVLDAIVAVMHKRNYMSTFRIALDAAASTFYANNLYEVEINRAPMSSSEIIKYYEKLIRAYPIISIEDPLAEDDIEGWKEITARLNKQVMLVGDDIFVTNTKNLQHGIDNKIGNAVLIKPNQIGTVTETAMAIELARKNNYEVIASHRSGETEDVSLAHIAFGLGASYIKAGAPCRSERVAKYNELLRIC